jgi:hypothetical protein
MHALTINLPDRLLRGASPAMDVLIERLSERLSERLRWRWRGPGVPRMTCQATAHKTPLARTLNSVAHQATRDKEKFEGGSG